MRLFVTGLGIGAPSGRNRWRSLVAPVLTGMGCSHLLTWDYGLVREAAADWAREHNVPVTHFEGRLPPKPPEVSAWEIAEVGKPDLALGFWPGDAQRTLLQLLKSRGVRVVAAVHKTLDWTPL